MGFQILVTPKSQIEKLNEKWGYFGAPPISPADKRTLLHYYFNEKPKGDWPKVSISKEVIVNKKKDRIDLDIPFYKRGQSTGFLKSCIPEGKQLKETGQGESVPPAMKLKFTE